MNYFLKPHSLDITKLIENHRGKKIEELFPDYKIISNTMGQFIKLLWDLDDFPLDYDLLNTKKNLLYNLKTVFNIGGSIENRLRNRGIRTINDLKHSLRYRTSATEVLQAIKKKNFKNLMENRYICDLDVVFCFNLEDFLFIDIETLGIYNSPMFMVGIGYFSNQKYKIHILFARNLEEEIAICEHLKNKVLPRFKCFVSYNGKSFDIPFIANRFLYFFDENPMISSDQIPYKKSNTIYHHVDLYHNCRRKFKNEFENFSLTNMEEKLLGFLRINDIPSELMGVCYRKYLNDPNRYAGLIKECIEHNYYDVYSLPLILKKLL
ncbi:MAG: ribonuclease H-like domain-containing protein [Promethearchaeota archaeon]